MINGNGAALQLRFCAKKRDVMCFGEVNYGKPKTQKKRFFPLKNMY